MSGNRAQLTLLALLALQIVLILVFRSPFTEASRGTESRPLLPDLEAFSPGKLEIRGSEDGQVVSLVKSDGGWSIDELDGFPADGKKIDDLVTDLGSLRVKRPVVSSGRYHDAFKVGDGEFEARIRLWSDADDDPAADLIVGSSANYQTSHVRRADEDPVYEVRGLTPYQLRADAGAWIAKELVDVSEDEVVGLVVRNASGEFELEKRADGWTVKSPETEAETPLDDEEVDALVRAATSVRLTEAAGKLDEAAHGLAEPAVSVVLRWRPDASPAAEPLQQTLRVGAKVSDDEAKRYVTRSGFDYTGIVWESSVDRLMNADLDGLTAEPEAMPPVATEGATSPS